MSRRKRCATLVRTGVESLSVKRVGVQPPPKLESTIYKVAHLKVSTPVTFSDI